MPPWMPPDLPLHAATVTLNLALAIAVGAALSGWWVATGASPWEDRQGRRLRAAGLAALAIALLASAGGVWLEAAAMAEVPLAQAASAAALMLTETHRGTAWRIGGGALLLSMGAIAFSATARHPRRLLSLGLFALAGCLYTRSMVSHASAEGDFGVLMMADWLHLSLVCVWVGAVFVAGAITLDAPAGERTDDRHACARHLESLSMAATLALAGIVATGLFRAWHALGSPAALAGTPYGATLLLKLALVLLAVMLGGINRVIILPPLRAALRDGTPAASVLMRRFRTILRIEAGVLLAVLIVAAVLSATPAPTAG